MKFAAIALVVALLALPVYAVNPRDDPSPGGDVESGARRQDGPAATEARIDALIRKMTTEEKVTLLYGASNMSLRDIPRLKIPALKMSDGPLGIRWGTATAFPAPIALASTWDLDLAKRFGAAIAEEWHNKGRQVWLGPAFNIIRLPQNGRNFEYFSEDPYLAGRFAVTVIKAAQSGGIIACAKHFVANNQEHDRYRINETIDERTLREIYFPAFEAAVKEAHVGAIMAAYNRLNGPFCSANHWLLTDVLKKEWGFQGFVVSDWGAVHETVAPANAGLDLEMGISSPESPFWAHGKLLKAVGDGKVSMASIDDKVRRILREIIASGIMDTPATAPDVELVAHRSLVRQIAAEGAVLLKNDKHVLPFDRKKVRTIAVVGPNYKVARTGGGGSSQVLPPYSVGPLEGIRNVAGSGVKVNGVAGVHALDQYAAAPAAWLSTPDGHSGGLQGEYFKNKSLEGKPVMTRVDGPIAFKWEQGSPGEGVGQDRFSVRWSGKLTVPTTGDWNVGVATDDGARLTINGERVIDKWYDHGLEMTTINRHLIAGKPLDVVLEYYENGGDASAIFVCQQDDLDAAIAAAKSADAAVVCVGLDPMHESEGFDRPSIDLRPKEVDLIRKVAAVQPKTVVVVIAGS